MGSRSSLELAYIAGFLDGDGSLMLQLKKRSDSSKARFMCTICFYQDSRHEETLAWIREILGIGYLSRRNDGISELRINGYTQVRDIISRMRPFIRFKKIQAEALLEATEILASGRRSEVELVTLVDLMLKIQSNNYVTKRKKTRDELMRVLELTP